MTTLAILATVLSLNGEWKLDYWPQPDWGAVRTLELPEHRTVAASVPGNCELDLQKAGLLPEMELGTNCWIRSFEGNQYLYTKSFVPCGMPAGGRAELVFDGIDTLADVFLNGKKIGEAENMFIAHRFDVTDAIRSGTNVVQVLIRSDMVEARGYRLGTIGHEKLVPGGAELEPIRKAAHAVGWDILPRLMARGLWRGVRLETHGPVRIRDVAWFLTRHSGSWTGPNLSVGLSMVGRVEAPFAALDRDRIRLTLALDGREVWRREHVLRHFQPVENLSLSNPKLWWPKGLGGQPLYTAKVEILSADGETVASDVRRIGIRHVELVRENWHGPDRRGEFLFRVNGEKTYIRGVNWTPLDAYHGRDGEHLAKTLALVDDLNCNMIRVWGGGVYEPDAFYDWCDEKGVLVWQDFMTAGTVTPQDDEYAAKTRREAIDVVCRLRNHPSLALWCANNETDNAAWEGRGDLARLDPNRDRTSRRTLSDVCWEFDSSRPYLPGASYFDPEVIAGRARPSEGHIWGARLYYKVPQYTNNVVSFVGELGFHGCPARSSLERMMTPAGLSPWRDGKADWNLEWRCKATTPYDDPEDHLWNRNDIMLRQTKILFGETPKDLDDFIVASQLVQAEAMKTLVELYRSRKFNGMNGFIFWNVRDGWPVVSDAVVDYYYGRKLAYHAIRRAHRDAIVMLGDDHVAWAVNDARHPVKGHAAFTDRTTGTVLLEREFEIPANGRISLGTVPFAGQGVVLIEAVLGGEKFSSHFLYGEPPFEFSRFAPVLTELHLR